MTHKCIDNELFNTNNHLSDHSVYDDAAFMPFEEPVPQTDFLELGGWILQAQDGVISEADFQKLQHCLRTDPLAMKYYVEFIWLCASLHALYREKQAV